MRKEDDAVKEVFSIDVSHAKDFARAFSSVRSAHSSGQHALRRPGSAPYCAISPEVGVQKAYHEWVAAIGQAKGDPAAMVKFYAPHAVLLPTLSSEIMINHQGGLDGYFQNLTSFPNIHCVSEQLMTRVLSPDTAMNSGLYKFTYDNPETGETQTLLARFNFIYQEVDGEWLIVSHHSSVRP